MGHGHAAEDWNVIPVLVRHLHVGLGVGSRGADDPELGVKLPRDHGWETNVAGCEPEREARVKLVENVTGQLARLLVWLFEILTSKINQRVLFLRRCFPPAPPPTAPDEECILW